mmetsp:Transcript_4353/g.9692  ORF Transcript_4353/g.9692 Transcript_4353/m.9692 type:complete len:192 (+) Transcript_4353:903-1478(+)
MHDISESLRFQHSSIRHFTSLFIQQTKFLTLKNGMALATKYEATATHPVKIPHLNRCLSSNFPTFTRCPTILSTEEQNACELIAYETATCTHSMNPATRRPIPEGMASNKKEGGWGPARRQTETYARPYIASEMEREPGAACVRSFISWRMLRKSFWDPTAKPMEARELILARVFSVFSYKDVDDDDEEDD